jgi:chromosome segregation ATPase
MENQDIQEFAGSLSTLITKIKNNIEELEGSSESLRAQLNVQQDKINQLSTLNDQISNSVNEYRVSVSNHIKALNSQYEDFAKEQTENTADLATKIEAFKDILASIKETMTNYGVDLSEISDDTSKKIDAFVTHLNVSYEAWNVNSAKLITGFDNNLLELDQKISVKLDAAAQTVSSKLEPTLKGIISALEAANARMKRVSIINYAMILVAIIAIILAIIL